MVYSRRAVSYTHLDVYKRQIIHGENRFSELEKALSGISEKVLYTSLRELEEAEILVREVEQEQKPSIIRYYLAEEYAEVKEMIRAAHSFAEKYVRKNEIRQCGDRCV